MACVSLRRSPVARDLDSRSLPARSIRFSTPERVRQVSRGGNFWDGCQKVTPVNLAKSGYQRGLVTPVFLPPALIDTYLPLLAFAGTTGFREIARNRWRHSSTSSNPSSMS